MRQPKFANPDKNKTRLEKSKKQEIKSAKKYGGFTISRSGAGIVKADINTQEYKIEVKRTDKKSISIKKTWIEKIIGQSFIERKCPAIEIEIQGLTMVMISQEEFEYFLELRRKET